MLLSHIAVIAGTGAIAELGKIVVFLLTLSVLVILHEYGHFLVARRAGVRVNEFAVGMGPKLAGWISPRSGTLYSLRALPIGGYCAMEGEDNKSSEGEQQREFRSAGVRDSSNFQSKNPWVRLGIVVAGPVANFVLAYLILLFATLAFGVPSDVMRPVVGPVLDGSPAQNAGIRAGDRIVQIDGKAITSGTQLIATIHSSKGKMLAVVYDRNGQRALVHVTPQACPPPGKPTDGCIGFATISQYQRVGVLQAFAYSGIAYVNTVDAEIQNLVLIVTQFGHYASQISGPIGIGQVAVTYQSFGWGMYLSLAALLSFALGIFNLLPLPALDGGRAAFVVAELIRRRPVDPEKEAMVHIAGFAVLMVLMLVIAFHDITRIVSGQGVLN